MDNTSSTSSINFALINQAINRYIPIPLLFFGIIGNILNIFVFTRDAFRNNACVAYFLASTIFDSFVILVGLFPRLLNGFGVDPSQYSSMLCKLRLFITYFGGYAAAWCISLACAERYLCSSENVHRRQLITMKRAYLSMIFIILMGFIIFGEEFYCIDINQQLLGAPQSCYQLQQNINSRIFDSLVQFLFQILAPTLMMIVFGVLTLRNVRQKHHRTHPTQAVNTTILTVSAPSAHQQLQSNSTGLNKQTALTKVNRTVKKRDTQMITMLLAQVST